MSSKPKVSIVTISYNQEKYIKDALEGFIRQKTNFKYEVIIGDDCSTDKTQEIIENYAKKYPEIIKPTLRKKNIGIAPNLYDVMRQASGKYIALCEGDDYWTDINKLQRQVDFLDKNPEYALCFHPVKVVFENSEEEDSIYPDLNKYSYLKESNFSTESLLKLNFIQTNSVMYRRQDYFDLPENILPIDWYLHLYHAQFGKIGFIDKIMSVYRRHPEGIWWKSAHHVIWHKHGVKHLELYRKLIVLYGNNQLYRNAIMENVHHAIKQIVDFSDDGGREKLIKNYPEFSENILKSYERAVKTLHKNIDTLNKKIDEERSRTNALKLANDTSLTRLKKEQESHAKTRQHLNAVLNSYSFKLGRILLKIPGAIKKLLLQEMVRKIRQQRNIRRLQRLIKKKYDIKNKKLQSRHKVGIVIRSFYHPTSSTFVRLVSPFSSKLLQSLTSFYLIDGEAPILQNKTSTVIVQRTAIVNLADAIKLVEEIKKRHIKLFVDTDDAFGELTESHPQYKLQKERVAALDYVMRHADEVWFSTETLKDLYGLRKSKVVRNTLDDKVWNRLRKKLFYNLEPNEPLRMVYMGTTTHDEDFAIIVPVMQRLHQKYPEKFELHVIGVSTKFDEYPWMVQQKPKSSLYPNFVEWFNGLRQYDIGLSPLQDSQFNKNKSDIKCLDYLACGIRPVVSDVEAYNNSELDGLIIRVKNTEQDWYEILEKEILNRGKNRKKMQDWSKKGFNYILTKRSPEIAAKSIQESLGL